LEVSKSGFDHGGPGTEGKRVEDIEVAEEDGLGGFFQTVRRVFEDFFGKSGRVFFETEEVGGTEDIVSGDV
jgi:hypothetical protein